MSHKDIIIDTDVKFAIDPVTRAINNASGAKTTVIQHDHNSERFGFMLPRYIEGHDMMDCNRVEIHYKNTDNSSKEETIGVYDVVDMKIDEEDETRVAFSWLISQNATQRVGTLTFLVRFSCVTEDGTIEYAWNSSIFKGIFVSTGMYNSNAVVEQYADVLEQLKSKLHEDVEDVASFIITGTYDEENETLAMEATFAEITAAHEEGRNVKLCVTQGSAEIIFNLTNIGNDRALFVCDIQEGFGHINIYCYINDVWEVQSEGLGNLSNGKYSHAEGLHNIAFGTVSHVEGYKTITLDDELSNEQITIDGFEKNDDSGDIGILTLTSATENFFNNEIAFFHIDNWKDGKPYPELYEVTNKTIKSETQAEFQIQVYNGNTQAPLTEMDSNITIRAIIPSTEFTSEYGHAEGWGTLINGRAGHAEGYNTRVLDNYGHSEGAHTKAGYLGHAEGQETEAKGRGSHAEGYHSVSTGNYSHAEGSSSSIGKYSHTEGFGSYAEGEGAHAENNAKVYGNYSHAEGAGTTTADYSHAEGFETQAAGVGCHAEGVHTVSAGAYSHAEGAGTEARGSQQHVHGKANLIDEDGNYVTIVGNGKIDGDGKAIEEQRSNAYALDWDGNAYFAGDVYVGDANDTGNAKILVPQVYVDEQVGHIEAALDGIIAIQNELMGVSE